MQPNGIGIGATAQRTLKTFISLIILTVLLSIIYLLLAALWYKSEQFHQITFRAQFNYIIIKIRTENVYGVKNFYYTINCSIFQMWN